MDNHQLIPKRRYLVFDGYGKGDVFLYIYARSAQDILTAYPELKVVDDEEAYFATCGKYAAAIKEKLESHLTFDLDDPPGAFLKVSSTREPGANCTVVRLSAPVERSLSSHAAALWTSLI